MKFLKEWPFLGRIRVCFVEPPYFQMTVKPIFTHGLDVTELPGIAGWLVSVHGFYLIYIMHFKKKIILCSMRMIVFVLFSFSRIK